MKKPCIYLLLWFTVILIAMLFAPGTSPSRAETGGNDVDGVKLFHSLAAASRGDTASPEHRSGARPPFNGAARASTAGYHPEIRSRAVGKPILFEANHGQTHPNVAFLSKLPGANLFFTQKEIVLAVTRPMGPVHEGRAKPSATVLRLRFKGASPGVRMEAREPAVARSHYITGPSPGGRHTNIPLFTKIVYKNLYPGIDLCLYGNKGRLEYDFVVSPGTDPGQIRIEILGGERSRVDPEGNHIISTKDGVLLRQLKPLAYQDVGAERRVLPAKFTPMEGHRFGFRVASHDTSKPLIIDPVLDFSTYVGGARFDKGEGLAVDRQGNIYVAGQTQSTDFPVENPLHDQAGGTFDIFVLKFNPDGSELLFSTYIAGSQLDIAHGIAVDGQGSVYLTGETASDDFPLTDVLGTGGSGAFILKLSPDGSSLPYSVLFGGRSLEKGYDVAVDDFGNAYVTGVTASTDFPTQNAFQPERGGGFDAFVAKFSPDGSLVYATYLGGSKDDNLGASVSGGIGIAIDDAGNAYVTGDTKSTDFPTENAFQPSLAGEQDAFVTKIGPSGNSLIYSTYLGGSDEGKVSGEKGFDIGVDENGNAYVTGNTKSTDFPIHNAIQGALAGGSGDQDFFVSAFDPLGTGLVYSTYLGGKFAEASVAGGLAVDRCGNVSLAGTTNSNEFAIENLSEGGISGTRIFLTRIEAGGSSLLYSAHIGNGSSARVALGPDLAAYLTGHTSSSTFPAVNAHQEASGGDADAYVVRISHVRPVGDLPGQYIVCANEPLAINVLRNLSADPGREWFAYQLISGGIASPINFLTDAGLETYVQGSALNSYTPYTYTGNTLVPEVTLDALGMGPGDQIIYAYVYEKNGVLDLNHIVIVTAR